MREETRAPALAAPATVDRRLVLLLLLVGAALGLLLLSAAGSAKTFRLLEQAQPEFVLGVLLAQALRYLGSAGSTHTLARTFGRRLRLGPLYEVMLAGQAVNRTFSVGGAGGMFVRYSFLTRQRLHSGSVAALFLIEDVLGVITLSFVFAVGLLLVIAAEAMPQIALLLAGLFALGGATFAFTALQLYRRRHLVERIVHAVTRICGRVLSRLVAKDIYNPAGVQLAVDEFYAGMAHAKREPARIARALLYSLLRVAFDAASLYFAFWAVGFAIPPGILLVIFTSSTALSTLSGVPGELGVMETSLAMLSTSLGIAPPTAIGAILLFRALSYWLPIPLGYLAFGHLQRNGYI